MQRKLNTPTFSTPRTTGGNAKATNRAFVVEALVLLAFLAVSVAIILQLFSTAGIVSREAHKLSVSEHLATNAAESFAANPKGTYETQYFDKDGNKLETEIGAIYSVQTDITSTQTTAGTLYDAHITITNYELRYDGNVTYELDTKRYLSTLEGGGVA